LGWGDGAEVLKPQALRDDLAQILRAAAARYTGA
jgi:predicted DNA-binding transcriptional regulator YafY